MARKPKQSVSRGPKKQPTEPALRRVVRGTKRVGSCVFKFCSFAFFKVPVWCVLISISIVFTVFLLSMFVLNTPRDVAYRYVNPQDPVCINGKEQYRAVLAENSNSEFSAIESRGTAASDLEMYLRCSIQRHTISPLPAANAENKGIAIDYNLAFVELTETGAPVEVGSSGKTMDFNQLTSLLKYFDLPENLTKQHYVIAYVHGWRHDARLGDRDLARLRLYAAHADSFLKQRCREKKRYCDTLVTAIFVGWRGARILEDTWVGQILALTTLFDRKPVSERIGPAAVSALKAISKKLDALNVSRSAGAEERSRMVTIGHSLGGNALATSLKEEMMAIVRNHEHGTNVVAPFGDLIILLNPASEAYKWTDIQKETRKRITFGRSRPAETDNIVAVAKSHKFYSTTQMPIYVSFTSANSWPAGGYRKQDIREIGSAKLESRGDFVPYPSYDWATHDLFPVFKWDSRPLGTTLERLADKQRWLRCSKDYACYFEGKSPPRKRPIYSVYSRSLEWMLRRWAQLFRNFPFLNTNTEETTTIGHLYPLRSPHARFNQKDIASATNLGATHEFTVNDSYGQNTLYQNAADLSLSECSISDHWLFRARQEHRSGWDSGWSKDDALLFAQKPQPPNRPIRLQFRHGLEDSGSSPVVRGNDPFWNVRAHQTAMRGHDGVVSFPLICAMHQLVMDPIAEEPFPDRKR